MRRTVRILLDDPSDPEVAGFLEEHLADVERTSPPDSRHALDIAGLLRPDITFWTARAGAELLGCGALKELDHRHGEIKSMRSSQRHARTGVATRLLRHLIDTARERGYHRLSLETGSAEFFRPARALYLKHGFEHCAPFGDYAQDPNSVYMTLVL
ncbi:putative acetyltransferase [Actinopolyspora biskrensis]|uniref:Putative acetyltransferase n=1 Tax=Actinopolyspora biskrensis TaxID=1470178 RepID=A0A852Z216_9ACTN|nr:GNAT family N-acetyltransferase [Actinopolyspora biskrensis]NYH80568.1 putative acetyltransferase [Actinopolyspora biskrensis]